MENNKKQNKAIGWIILIILIILTLALNYIKFFANIETDKVEETPANTQQSEVIETALTNIVDNFNELAKANNSEENSLKLSAAQNQYTIFISYETTEEGTYEFNYDNLAISIKLSKEEANKEAFKEIYKKLAQAVQKRINNEANVDEVIKSFLEEEKEYEGLTLEKDEEQNTITYTMNITKKLGTTAGNTESVESNQATNTTENTETSEEKTTDATTANQ